MSEIYWITRLDSLCAWMCTLMVFAIIASVVFIIVNCICRSWQEIGDPEDVNTIWTKLSGKFIKWTIPLAIFLGLALSFTPNTKEAMLIYGVGGSIDYLKENPTAQKLPDKVLEALDGWVDSWNNEHSNNND